ncbi:MAG: tetratricopeptide repeat protein [Xanthomonadales bacterium]|nr:tetratricopeptide repeat protein [Xanthomonadales bacterium]
MPNAPKEWQVVTLIGLGRTLAAANDLDHAEAVLREAIPLVPLHDDQLSTNRIEARTILAKVRRQRGDSADADRLLSRSDRVKPCPGALSPSLHALLDDGAKQ